MTFFDKLQGRGHDLQELVGWCVILLALPINYRFGDVTLELAPFAIAISLFLTAKYGSFGLKIFAIFAAPLILPLSIFYNGLAYGAPGWIYIVGLFCGYMRLSGPRILGRVRELSKPTLAAILVFLPLRIEFNAWEFETLDGAWIDLEPSFGGGGNLLLFCIAVFGAAAIPRKFVFAIAALSMLLGAVLLAISTAQPTWLNQPDGNLNLWHSFNDIGGFVSALVAYELARFLVSFDRRFPSNLAGRRLPDAWTSLGLILLLTFGRHWIGFHSEIPNLLRMFGSVPSLISEAADTRLWLVPFLLTCVFAGFRFRLAGSFFVAAAVLIAVAAGSVRYSWFDLNLFSFLAPFVFGWLGQLWRQHTHGMPVFRVDPVWARYALALAFGVMLASYGAVSALGADDVGPQVDPIVGSDPDQAAIEAFIVFGVPIWLALMLGTYALAGPRGPLAQASVALRGKALDILNLVLLAQLAVLFGSAVIDMLSRLNDLFPFLITGELADAGFAAFEQISIAVIALWSMMIAFALFIQTIIGMAERFFVIGSRTEFRVLGQDSDLPQALGWDEQFQFGITLVRSLGLAVLVGPLAVVGGIAIYLGVAI